MNDEINVDEKASVIILDRGMNRDECKAVVAPLLSRRTLQSSKTWDVSALETWQGAHAIFGNEAEDNQSWYTYFTKPPQIPAHFRALYHSEIYYEITGEHLPPDFMF